MGDKNKAPTQQHPMPLPPPPHSAHSIYSHSGHSGHSQQGIYGDLLPQPLYHENNGNPLNVAPIAPPPLLQVDHHENGADDEWGAPPDHECQENDGNIQKNKKIKNKNKNKKSTKTKQPRRGRLN